MARRELPRHAFYAIEELTGSRTELLKADCVSAAMEEAATLAAARGVRFEVFSETKLGVVLP